MVFTIGKFLPVSDTHWPLAATAVRFLMKWQVFRTYILQMEVTTCKKELQINTTKVNIQDLSSMFSTSLKHHIFHLVNTLNTILTTAT